MPTQVFTTPGTHTFTSKVAVKLVNVKCWGAGGGGGMGHDGGGTGPGGGGGGFAQSDVNISESTSYDIIVGAGGSSEVNGGNSYFDDGVGVLAFGGTAGNSGSTGGGGTGSTVFTGGNGGADADTNGGGGGGGAGDSENGTDGADGSLMTGGLGGSADGGNGGSGTDNDNGNIGSIYGGGGGGGGDSEGFGDTNGGSGAKGKVEVSYTSGYLSFFTQPTNTASNSTIASFQVKIHFGDDDSVDTNYTGSVTIAIDNNPNTGTLSGTTTKNAVAGVVTFDDLSINHSGTGYTLVVSATDLTSGTSTAFNITGGNTLDGNSSVIVIVKINNRSISTFRVNSSIIATGKISNRYTRIVNFNSSCIAQNKLRDSAKITIQNKDIIEAKNVINDYSKISIKGKNNVSCINLINNKIGLIRRYRSDILGIGKILQIPILGRDPFTTFCNFYIHGHTTNSSGINLYTQSAFFNSGSLTLFEAGPTYGVMNLYVRGLLGGTGSKNVNLFSLGTSTSGLFSTTDLFLGYQSGFPNPYNSLNLFEQVLPSSTSVNALNLVLYNDNSLNTNLNLFLTNEYVVNSGNLDLYLEAPSGTAGTVPYSGNMNLYIGRDSEGLYGVTDLYLNVNNSISGTFDMSISGSNPSTNNVTLYSRGIDTINYTGLDLYGQGF
jgi:hypothetical protein